MKRKKNLPSKIILIVLCALLAAALIWFTVGLITEINSKKVSKEITENDAQELIERTIEQLPTSTAKGAKYVAGQIKVNVEGLEYGQERDVKVSCSYETLNAGSVINSAADQILSEINQYYDQCAENGKKAGAIDLQIRFENEITDIIKSAEKVNGKLDITIYQMNDGSLSVYLEDNTVDTLFGGLLSAKKAISAKKSITTSSGNTDIANKTTIRTSFISVIAFTNYQSAKPETGGPILNALSSFGNEFYRNFIENDMWKYLVSGTLTTLEITGLALILGIILGVIVAIVRVSYDSTHSLPILNAICKTYLAVIRGTPVMVQMLIIYFVILAPLNINKFIAAILCFGINSGAYVSEIIRGGILSVDPGQMEAGRSLGLNFRQTMARIIIPQAFKASLPSLANEFIALLKETSVAFYIGVSDLTQSGLRIRTITYSNFMPLIAIALIYLVIVLILTKLVSMLEQALRKSERRGHRHHE